jgi:hypothetical protein
VQGALQIVADALRIDTGAGQCGQAEVFAEVVDAEGQAIVAVLLGLKQLHALPAVWASAEPPPAAAHGELNNVLNSGVVGAIALQCWMRASCVFVLQQLAER